MTGLVQVDDAYWGGERRGGKRGRGAAGKTPFVAAVACSANGRPRAMRMTPLKGFCSESADRWARRQAGTPSWTVESANLNASGSTR